MRGKFVVFLFGVIVTVVAAVGLALSLNFIPAFLSILPTNLAIYFSICIGLGVAAMILSKSVY
jgi:hypothetical protein